MTTMSKETFDNLDYAGLRRLKANLEKLLVKMEKAESKYELDTLVATNQCEYPAWFFVTVEQKACTITMQKTNYWHYAELLRTSPYPAHLFDTGCKIKAVSSRFTEEEITKLRKLYSVRMKEIE